MAGSVVSSGGAQATFCATVVDEWIAHGMRHAVLCPGSRSTPLALALASRSEVTVHVRLDERSAGFVALGLARALSQPVPIVVTSGTAVAELHAAVAEADLSQIPVIVVSGDRPPELHDVRAPQTIAQHGIFGTAVRASIDPGVPVWEMASTWRSIATRVWLTANGGTSAAGPVHLNCPFREPLVEEAGDLPPRRHGGWRSDDRPGARSSTALNAMLAGASSILVVAGAGAPASLSEICHAKDYALIADPRSGLRSGAVTALADPILRTPGAPQALRPDVVLRIGEAWASKVLNQQIERWADEGTTVIHLSSADALDDPHHIVALRVVVEPDAIGDVLGVAPAAGDASIAHRWIAAETAARAALDIALDESNEAALSEVAIARAVAEADFGALVVSSSMPIRDLEWFAPRVQATSVLSNRGANGIDGVTSTAIGTALGLREPVGLLIGDLAFAHDLSALVDGLGGASGSLAVVVVDNRGGGIFKFLPQATSVDGEVYDSLFQTARPMDHRAVAVGLGHSFAEATTLGSLRHELAQAAGRQGITIIHAPVSDVSENVAQHAALQEAVAKAVGSVLS